MSSAPVTPTPSFDFSNIEGHLEHAWEDVKDYAKGTVSPQNEQAAEQELKNNETQREGEKQYSDFLYKNDSQEYRQADPVGYVGRKLEDAVTAPMEQNRTSEEKTVIDPGAREIASAGLGAYGVPQNGTVGTTEGMHEGTILPEGEGAVAEPELDFSSIEGHQERPDLAQGGHAGGGVASVEELNRPGRFVKVSRSGQLTDQGKVPDFNLQHGEAGYQVTPEGYELKAGQETSATKSGVDKYHKEVFKPTNPKAGAEGTKTPHQQAISEAGGTYKGESNDGLVEITLPRKVTEHLPVSDRFKDFVSVTMPKGKITMDSVRAAMEKKFSDMGGDPTMFKKALAKD